MRYPLSLVGFVALVSCVGNAAHAVNFTLNPATLTVSPNYVGPITISGTITNATGRLDQFGISFAFNSTFTAGINGVGSAPAAAFLAWNRTGSYSGDIYVIQMNSTCLGYNNGMPLGHYANKWGGGPSALSLTFRNANGTMETVSAQYAIDVVPAPGACTMLALAGFAATRRRRRERGDTARQV